MWVSPSGILGWREAKAEDAKSKAKKSEEKRVTANAILTWKGLFVAMRKQRLVWKWSR